MTEPQIRALFKEIADEPAASRVDPQFTQRRGRARLRWRRAGLAGASAVAAAAVITTSLAISGAIQDGPTGPGGDVAAASLVAKVPPYFVAPREPPGAPRGRPEPGSGRRDRKRCGAGNRRAAQGVPGVHDGDRRCGRPDVHLCRRARVASGSGHVPPAGAEPVRSPGPPEAAAAPAGNQQPLGPGGIPRRQQACHVGLQSP